MTTAQFIYRMRFRSFIDFAFRELHPGEVYRQNWHIDLMADILQLIYSDPSCGMNRLIFNLPPAYLKTHVCSVSFPAWILGRDPRKSVLILSEHPESAFEIQERIAALMSSNRYRATFPRALIRNRSRALELEYGGGIRHAGIGYTSHHKKSDVVIIDNPQSLHNLNRLNPEHLIEISRLLKDPKEGIIVLVSRRLGENDLSAFLHQKMKGWGKFAISAIAVKNYTWDLPPDIHHIQKKGALLHQSHEEWEEVMRHLHEIGGEAFCYQYLQGLYFPPKEIEQLTFEKNGRECLSIRGFNATRSVSKHLTSLRSQYDLNLSV